MNKIYFSIAAIFLCVGIGLGVIIGMNYVKNHSTLSDKYNAPNTFDAGWEAAKKKIEETPYVPMGTSETKKIDGKITKTEQNKIEIEARLLNPLDDEKLKNRTIDVDDNTEIIINRQKDRETIRKEQDDYNAKIELFRQGKISEMPTVPTIDSVDKGTAQNLKEGELVTIESNDNIREALEIKAAKITVR